MKDEMEEGNFDVDGYYHWKSKDVGNFDSLSEY